VPAEREQIRIVAILEEHLSNLDAAGVSLAHAVQKAAALRASALATEIPSDDPHMTLAELAARSGYGTSEKCTLDGVGPVVVRIPNVVDGRVDMGEAKRVVNPNADVSFAMLREGDVLIVRTNGSRELIGRAAVVDSALKAAFASYLIRYQFRADLVHPEWVVAALASPGLRGQIERAAASSAGQYNLSLAKLNPLRIPVPSLEEQNVRLARLDSWQRQTRRLAVSAAECTTRSTFLRRALLGAAFSGQLLGRASDLDRIEEMADASNYPR
jgi:type I restriction enzyme S subunit